MKPLFLCVGNSIRSQIAEGVAKALLGPAVPVQSAGIAPSGVHPLAAQVLSEIGVDARRQRSKSVHEIDPAGVDTVVTLCEREVCPPALAHLRRLHWPMPDPLLGGGDAHAVLERFRALRDELGRRIEALAKEPRA